MEMAMLINERAVRSELRKAIGRPDLQIDEYATATEALKGLSSKGYALIVIDWKVYPGFGSDDPAIAEYADMIPKMRHNENLLYWQVELRVLESIRAAESPNRDTGVLLRLPEIPPIALFGVGDDLTRESIEEDLRGKEPVEAFYGVALAAWAEAMKHRLDRSAEGA